MAIPIPTTQQLIDTFVSTFEAKIGQTVPLLERSFISVLARVLAISDTGLYKYAANRILQSLALTATGDNLDLIGVNYGVYRIAGTPASVYVVLAGNTGAVLPQTASFVADNSGVMYYVDSEITFDDSPTPGQELFLIIAESVGSTGNAVLYDTFTLTSPVSGLSPTAVYSADGDTGVDREADTAYRRRILDEIRTVGGAGNGVDYRRWGEQSASVARIYPYSGKPADGSEGLVDEPGDRTIYVRAATAYGTGDRTADTTLLSAVRELITTDPDTSFERVPLGCPDSTLFVKSIANQDIWVTVSGLVASGTTPLVDVKTSVEAALEDYLLELEPYVEGVDVEVDRNDKLTGISLARVVQQVLEDLVASATGITFSLTEGGASAGSYTLPQGFLTQLGGVDYD